MDEETEKRRMKYEARHWIRRFGFKTIESDELLLRIAKIRGKPAAERLREAMQEQIKHYRRNKSKN